jgi:hypothetical protein
MARARNIKPGFFQNEDLGQLSPLTRLAFIGMWTIADFKGCIEFRPMRLKVQILPYDNCDIEEIAINLDKSGLIRKYSVQGKQYIKIVNFERHQNPHKNERDAGSEIPDIQDADEKNNEINELTKDGTKPDKIGTTRADSLILIPDSLILIPDSLIPEKTTPQQAASAKAPKFDAIAFFEPHLVSPQVLNDWLRIRKGKRLVSTETAFNGFIAEVHKTGMCVADAIQLCCVRGWGGLDAEWLKPKSQASPALVQNQNSKLGVHGQATANAAQRWLENSNA